MTSVIDTNDSLDTSWFQEYDKLLNIDTNFAKEVMNTIDIKFLYIDSHNNIQHIFSEQYNLHIDASGSFLLKDDLLMLIQQKKYKNNIKYKLDDILFYHVPIDHTHISEFTSQPSQQDFLKKISFFDSLHIPDSIFIFHPINSLYFFFKENESTHNFTIKSILKSNSSSSRSGKTKKVNINEVPIFQIPTTKPKKKRTRKNIHS